MPHQARHVSRIFIAIDVGALYYRCKTLWVSRLLAEVSPEWRFVGGILDGRACRHGSLPGP
jgi:hypothetical protein